MNLTDVPIFTRAYVQAMFFTDQEQLDEQMTEAKNCISDASFDDLAPATLAAVIADCTAFQKQNAGHWWQGRGHRNLGADAGHDFWLTRNGYGAGFWDCDWPEPKASQLTDAALAFGPFELYVGDDGLIYASGHEPHVPECPAIDGFPCRCPELLEMAAAEVVARNQVQP